MEHIEFTEPMPIPSVIARKEAYDAWNRHSNTNLQDLAKVPPRSAEEVLAHLKGVTAGLSRILACFYVYPTWTDELIVDMTNDIYLKEPLVTAEELAQLTKAQLIEIGFRHWSNESDLLLIPIYLYRALHPRLKVFSISDEPPCCLNEVDTDARYGLLAYGIKDYRKDNN